MKARRAKVLVLLHGRQHGSGGPPAEGKPETEVQVEVHDDRKLLKARSWSCTTARRLVVLVLGLDLSAIRPGAGGQHVHADALSRKGTTKTTK